MSVSRVILWRHGRTEFNHTGRWQGQLDVPLDAVGVSQAEAAADILAVQTPSAIISSDLQRASVTANALAKRVGVSVDTDRRLREIDVGEWQGRTADEVLAGWSDDYHAYRQGADLKVGGGESRSQVVARMLEAIAEAVESRDGTIVVVSHGAAIRSAIIVMLGLGDLGLPAFSAMGNANWCTFVPRGGGLFRLIDYNVSASEGRQPDEVWANVPTVAEASRPEGQTVIA